MQLTPCRAQDWPADFVLGLETSWSLVSFDTWGYPCGIALNALHLLTRLSVFAAAIPAWFEGRGGAGALVGRARSAKELADADARLEVLRRKAVNAGTRWGWRLVSRRLLQPRVGC